MRRGADVQLDASQKAGAKGAIGTQSKTKHALRKGGAKGGTQQALARSLAEQEGPVDAVQLREVLVQNAVRVIGLVLTLTLTVTLTLTLTLPLRTG